MNGVDLKDAPFLAVGIALNLMGIWSEDSHFTKQALLPIYSNKMLNIFTQY
jgi:predicted nucleic acid-binding protein